VKIVATLLAYGRSGLGEMVDTCHDMARHFEQLVRREERLELVAPAELTVVLFRYHGASDASPAQTDQLNAALRRILLERGVALIGRTRVRVAPEQAPSVCLKVTLLNPTATPRDMKALLEAVLAAGIEAERQAQESRA
jgi:L-2,4-diaminobutyrate decarboxylase